MSAESDALFRKVGEAAAEESDYQRKLFLQDPITHNYEDARKAVGRAALKALMGATCIHGRTVCMSECLFALPDTRCGLLVNDGISPGPDCPMHKEGA